MTLLKLKIRCSTGEDYSIEIDDSKTVLEFKNEIEKQFNVPSSSQRLIYRGRILQDDKTCKEYGIQTEQTVHMVKAKTATSTPPSSAPAEPTTATTTPAAQTQPPPSTTSTTPPASTPNPSSFLSNLGFGANPYGLPMPPLGANAFSPANLQAQAQQLMQNPEMLRNLMNNPMVQSMLNNPEIMQNMVNQNPQMRQVMEEHPELAQVVNNPQLMQETMELMRNPETMQEILRSQDLAMRNLESIDGGTDALRRMYNDVAEPMMNAAADMNRTVTPTTVPSQPSSTLYNDAVPNPWGAGGTSSTTTVATGTAPPVFPPYFANMFGTAPSPVSSTLTPPSATTTASGTTAPPTTPATASPATTSTVPPAAPGATSSSTTTQPPPPLPPFGLGGAMPNSPDPAMLQGLLSNPATASMMQSMMNDPQTIELLINMNPAIKNNPMMCSMLRNPEMRSQLFNPQTLQAALQMQQQFGGGMNPAAANPYMNPMFMQPPPTTSTLPPREQYATQLEELKSMGFYDEDENLRILQICNGNINMAVDRLLQN